jgi:hypothetical protein
LIINFPVLDWESSGAPPNAGAGQIEALIEFWEEKGLITQDELIEGI